MNFLLSIVVPCLIIGGGIFSCIVLWKKKYGELFLVIYFLAVVLLTGWACGRGTFCKDSSRHMEAAFIKAASMIKNGDKQILQSKLSALMGTREFKCSNAYRFAVAFRQAVDDSFSLDNDALLREAVINGLMISIVGFLLLFVWGVLYLAKCKKIIRMVYLVTISGQVAFCFFVMSVSVGTNNGYNVTFYRFNVKDLSHELENAEFSPAMLKLMEEPKKDGYSYFRNLSALEEEMGIKRK